MTRFITIIGAISFGLASYIMYAINGKRNLTMNIYYERKGRLPNAKVPWNDKTPEEKLLVIIKIMIFIFGLHMLVRIIMNKYDPEETTIISLILSNKYKKGLNIFSLSACALVTFVIIVGVSLLKKVLGSLVNSFGTNFKAVTKLLLSILQYAGVIGSLLYCLYLLGFDTTKILASIGILTTVIGIGAKSIINDIVAGIFMICEGSFKVGDIVNIGGFRGTVQEIGLRTTSVVDANNNVKIFSNSNISGIINMSRNISSAKCSLMLSYTGELSDLESMVQELLPILYDENTDIVDNVRYEFTGFKEGGVTLVVYSPCFEDNRQNVGNFVNRRLLELFDDKGNVKVLSATIDQN